MQASLGEGGVTGIGESENNSLPDNCYFDSERETYLVREEGTRGSVRPAFDGIFPLLDGCVQRDVAGERYTVACEPSRFDHTLET